MKLPFLYIILVASLAIPQAQGIVRDWNTTMQHEYTDKTIQKAIDLCMDIATNGSDKNIDVSRCSTTLVLAWILCYNNDGMKACQNAELNKMFHLWAIK